jgi:hypothetical protein
MEVCYLHAPAALFQVMSPWYLFNGRLGGPLKQSGRDAPVETRTTVIQPVGI